MAGREDKEPLHQRIADSVRERIVSGELAPGATAPSENELMKTHDISRTTARQALAALKDEGLLEARQGASTKVRRFEPIRRNSVERLSTNVWGAGHAIWDIDVPDRSRGENVTVDEIPGPAHILRAFDLPTGSRFCRRSRHFTVDEKPVMLAVSYLDATLVASTAITQEDSGPGGIYARLGDLGRAPVHFREEIRSQMPTPEEKKALALSPGTPVIRIVRSAYDANDAIVEVNEMTLDANAYILEYTFSA
jgi:GntR family transcriptional regulator